MIPRIPERDVAVARHLGLRETDIQKSWERYVKWSTERFGDAVLLGGEPWAKWAREDAINLAKNREAQDEAKDRKRREDEAYRASAMSFSGWVAGLARKAAAGVQLPRHEAQVVEWYQSLPKPRPDGWSCLTAFAAWRLVRGEPCDCVRCRTVLIVDQTGHEVGRRTLAQAPFGPGRGLAVKLPVDVPTDEDYAARRAQSREDLRAWGESEFTDGLGLNAGTPDVPSRERPLLPAEGSHG